MQRAAVLLVLVAIWSGSTADAGFLDTLYRGLEVYSRPLGGPLVNAGDGTMVNGARAGRLRVVPSGIGDGYELQLDRSFGADSRGRPEIFHFGGVADLQLSGATQLTAGYNGEGFRTYRLNFGTNQLNYDLRSKLGVQDARLTGTLDVSNAIEINNFGFYTLNMNAANSNSQLTLDGVVVKDQKPTNFNVGPLTLRGNIFVDGFASVIAALGGDTSSLASLFPESPIGPLSQAIATDRQAAAGAAAIGSAGDMSPLLLKAILSQDGQAAQALMQGLADGTLSGNGLTASADGDSQSALVPEPGTLLLVAAGGLTFWLRRRK